MKDENRDESAADLDAAERLLNLIDKILSLSVSVHQGKRVRDLPLFASLPVVAGQLDYPDYMSFLTDFLDLVRVVRLGVRNLDLKKESVRENMIARLVHISSVFDAENFASQTSTVFGGHFSDINRQALEDISERFQAQGNIETEKKKLTSATSDIEEIASILQSSERVSGRAKRLIRIHINHLKSVLAHYDTVGEKDFWDTYRVLFAMFVELHDYAFDEDREKKAYREKLKKVLGNLLVGSSLLANAVTIAGPAMTLLQ